MTKKTEKVATETPVEPKTLLKTCSHCGRILPASEFYKSGKGRLREECKTCNKEETHERYLEKKGLADADFAMCTPLGEYKWKGVVAKKDAKIINEFVRMVGRMIQECRDLDKLSDTQRKLIKHYEKGMKIMLWIWGIWAAISIARIIYILSS